MNILKDNKALEKKDEDTYIWRSEFVAELPKDEAIKNAKHLKADIEKAKEDYKSHDPDAIVKNSEKQFENEKEMLEQAYKDYDNYLSEKIREMKRNKLQDKKKIKETLDKFDEYKENRLGQIRESTENTRDNIKRLLDDRKESLKHYTQYFDIDEDEDESSQDEE